MLKDSNERKTADFLLTELTNKQFSNTKERNSYEESTLLNQAAPNANNESLVFFNSRNKNVKIQSKRIEKRKFLQKNKKFAVIFSEK